MPFQQIPTNLILGFLGVGKTTAIKYLLKSKPKQERWAVLVNEFGQVGVDAALLSDSGVAIKEIPGGCLCCVGSQSMTVGLNELIRRHKPDRILIEPTGLGHPSQLIESLTGEFYEDVLDLRATITLLDARQLSDPRYYEHPAFTDQIYLADVLVANKCDTYTEDDKSRFLHLLAGADPKKEKSAIVSQGHINSEWLDLPRSLERQALFPEAHRYLSAQNNHSDHKHEHEQVASCIMQDWLMYEGESDGFYSVGWQVSPDYRFEHEPFLAWLEQLYFVRFKGVIQTDRGWFSFNKTESEFEWLTIEAQTASKLEIVHAHRLDAAHLDEHLKKLTLSG